MPASPRRADGFVDCPCIDQLRCLHPGAEPIHYRRKADDLIEDIRPQGQSIDASLSLGELHRRLTLHAFDLQPRVVVFLLEESIEFFDVATTSFSVESTPQDEKTLCIKLECVSDRYVRHEIPLRATEIEQSNVGLPVMVEARDADGQRSMVFPDLLIYLNFPFPVIPTSERTRCQGK